MSKLSYTQIKKLLKKCGIGYDHKSIMSTPFLGINSIRGWDHGYDAIYGYNGYRREFYYDLFKVMGCIKEYIVKCGISYFIVSPLYRGKAFALNYSCCDYYDDIVSEIRSFLKANNIIPKTQSGTIVDANDLMTISMIMEGAFRGASLLCLFSPERGVVIQPDHHFQVTFYTAVPNKESSILDGILENYSGLERYSSDV